MVKALNSPNSATALAEHHNVNQVYHTVVRWTTIKLQSAGG